MVIIEKSGDDDADEQGVVGASFPSVFPSTPSQP